MADLAGADPVVQAFTSLIERNASLCVRAVKAQATVLATVRALPGRLSGLSVPEHFRMKIHFVWGFCMGAQGA